MNKKLTQSSFLEQLKDIELPPKPKRSVIMTPFQYKIYLRLLKKERDRQLK